MYVGLVILALINATIRRCKLRRLLPTEPFSTPVLQPQFAQRYREILSNYSFHISVFRLLFASFVCVSYVCFTYIGVISPYLWYTLKSIGAILFAYVISVVATADRPISVVANILAFVEVLSLSSTIFAQPTDWLNFSFLQACSIMTSYFTLEPAIDVYFNFKSSQVQRQLVRLTVQFFMFIYIFACGLQLFEHLGEPWDSLSATTFELTLANSFYFTVVTLFTVGYGDFVPFTLLGRLWIIFIIVFGAYLITRKIGQVVDVVSDLRRGRGSFVKAEGTEHCVICGHVKWEYLKSFVQEFYEDERNYDKKLVVICDKPNWTEDVWSKFSATHTRFRQHVTYLEGACATKEDLVRAQVETALAVFVLCNQHNPDPYAEDSEMLKRILTIRSYTPNLPIYAMCALRDSMLQISFALEHLDENDVLQEGVSRRPSMDILTTSRRRDTPFDSEDVTNQSAMRDFSDDDDDDDGLLVHCYDGSSDLKSEAICMQEIEMSLMAENVFCNGLSTLLANLILRIDPINKPTDRPWAVEYKIGSECRFEYIKLPTSLHNRKFGEIAVVMYDYGVVLIATKRFMEQKWRAITPDTILKINTIGLIVTFHSAQFLDVIMRHIATRVGNLFEESLSNASTQEVPSVEGEINSPPAVPHHSISGGYLAGDLSMTYTGNLADAYSPDVSFASMRESWTEAPTAARPPSQSAGSLDIIPTRNPPKHLLPPSLSINEALETSDSASALGLSSLIASAPPPASSSGPVKLPSEDKSKQSPAAVTRNQKGSPDEKLSSQRNIVATDDNDPVPKAGSEGTFKGHGMSSDLSDKPKPRKTRFHHVTFPSQPAHGRSGVVRHYSCGRNDREVLLRASSNEELPFLTVYYGDEELPHKVRGHIVVCAIGEMSVMNLKYFLRKVWAKRGGEDENATVVAICPMMSDDEEAELSSFMNRRLYIIHGNSLNVKTLQSAQFDEARAIVILACEDQTQIEEMDAKAMFTVMTLDYLLGEDSTTFVCTMLDAEESMQLLRAPTHSRRTGVVKNISGNGVDMALDMGMVRMMSAIRRYDKSSFSKGSNLFDSRDTEGSRFRSRAVTFAGPSGSRGISQSVSFGGFLNHKSYTNRRETIANLVVQGEEEGSFGGMKSFSFLSHRPFRGEAESFGGGRDDDRMSKQGSMPLGFEPSAMSIGRSGTSAISGDPRIADDGHVAVVDGFQEIYSRPRDESFEKQRYASGEMMISSSFMTLLIREYAMPGLSAIVRKIFGAGFTPQPKSKKPWIRSVKVPSKWLKEGQGGQRVYREVFETLLLYGAIPIGLYRAGTTNVRVQVLEGVDGFEEVENRSDITPSESFDTFQGTSSLDQTNPEPFEMGGVSSATGYGRFSPNTEQGRVEWGEESRSLFETSNARYGATDESGNIDNAESSDSGRIHSEAKNDPAGSSFSNRASVLNRGEKVPLTEDVLKDIVDDVNRAQEATKARQTDRDADPVEVEGDGEEKDMVVHKYVCPNTGRVAFYHEIEGGGNVLPYVYTNPEPYTLVSEHDTVFVLVAPPVNLPEHW